MVDLRWVRAHAEEARCRLESRGAGGLLERVLALDAEQRQLLAEVEALRSERNRVSQEINRRVKAGEGADGARVRGKEISARLAELEPRLSEVSQALEAALRSLPNLPHPDSPTGSENRLVRACGEPARPPWVRPHWEVGADLGILDMACGSRLAASRFPVLRGLGAALQRALVQFMLGLAARDGFVEVAPPLLANAETLAGSGHLPKFEADLYRTDGGLCLIPTAEVPLVNLHRGEVLDAAALPRRYVAVTPCFRKEAGAPGKETRGLIRVHQFEKVERVSFTRPEESQDELVRLTSAAEEALRQLQIPCRVVELCRGELSFSACRTFDVEAWFPALGRYLEVSSCSDCGDFQARRTQTRFRGARGRLQFVHTLNGSSTAVGRTLAALLENGQRPDGTLGIPEALVPYLGEPAIGAR